MSTIDSTVTVMKSMSESSRKRVLVYAQQVAREQKGQTIENPFVPLTKERVMKDLAISQKECEEGKVQDFREAIMEMRKQHGFV